MHLKQNRYFVLIVTHSDLDIFFSDISDLKNPPGINDDVLNRFCGQQIDVALLSKKPELAARTIRVHQIDVLVSTDP